MPDLATDPRPWRAKPAAWRGVATFGLAAIGLAMPGLASAAADAGDPARGAAIVASRSQGLCVLCHAVPGTPAPLQGNLAPDLAGVGARWTADQLRERLVEPERFNPGTLMPSYRRSDGFVRVAEARRGQALFNPQQLDDVVAYLATLR